MKLIAFHPPFAGKLACGALFFGLAHLLKQRFGGVVCLVQDEVMFARLVPAIKQKTAQQVLDAGTVGSDSFVLINTDDSKARALVSLLQNQNKPVLVLLKPGEPSLPAWIPAHTRFIYLTGPQLDDLSHLRRWLASYLAKGFDRRQILFSCLSLVTFEPALRLFEKEAGVSIARVPFDADFLLASENEGRFLDQMRPAHPFIKAMKKWLEQLDADTFGAAAAPPSPNGHNEASMEKRIMAGVWRRMAALQEQQTPFEPSALVQAEMETMFIGGQAAKVDSYQMEEIRRHVLNQIQGFGPLEKFLNDPSLNEIMVNGVETVFIERDGALETAPADFESEEQLRFIAERMVGRMGRRVDTSSPLCDVRLTDGSRVNVVLPPISVQGPIITIRKFKSMITGMEHLISLGTLTQQQAEELVELVAQRKNLIVAGNSGSGKTTLLNILASAIPESERIITIEDAAELKIAHRHVVRLEARVKNAEGLGEVSLQDLVVNALRMRPDRLVIGECRGAESIPMLQAMNTGHDGCMTTLHANSAEDALERLQAMVLLGAPQWPPEVVRKLICSGVNAVIYLKRSGSRRRLEQIYTVASA